MKVFYVTTDENEVKDIALNGFKCRESAAEIDNLLGPSRHGLHFSKHIDLLLNYQYSRRVKEFYVILAEVSCEWIFVKWESYIGKFRIIIERDV